MWFIISIYMLLCSDGVSSWTEFFIKQALYLYLSMLPDNPSYLEL